jgi:elongation factor G
VREVLAHGHIAGYPMHDVRVIVYDGKHHPVDSKEVAFIAAGRKAFLDALAKARPIVLEPIVNVQIVCQQSHMGDITGDLSSRRGQVTGTNNLAGLQMAVSGSVPMSELDGYSGRLKAITQGSGSYSMELSHFEPVPPNIQQQLAAAHKGHRWDE